MNTLARIEDFETYKFIGYYSLRSELKGYSEAEDFFIRMDEIEDIQDDLDKLWYWLEQIADKTGWYAEAFRHEGICVALPPKKRITGEYNDLRLYCHLITNNVVVLFNGGIKTQDNPEDCPNVKQHFSNAKGWAYKLDREKIETDWTEIIDVEEIFINY